METGEQNEDFQRLHQLIAGDDIKGFADGMTLYAATTMTRATGARIECAVTLRRRKRALTIAGSSDEAIVLDGMEQAMGAGPALEALQSLEAVVLSDVQGDQRWPMYSKDLDEAGVRSVLAVPLVLGSDASAALSFFSYRTGVFTDEAIGEARVFTDMAGQALRIALQLATATLLAEDLKAAMEHRTAIDLACGMIMTENSCSQDEAFAFLSKASQNRNQKVHDVATSLIRGRAENSGGSNTHFED